MFSKPIKTLGLVCLLWTGPLYAATPNEDDIIAFATSEMPGCVATSGVHWRCTGLTQKDAAPAPVRACGVMVQMDCKEKKMRWLGQHERDKKDGHTTSISTIGTQAETGR